MIRRANARELTRPTEDCDFVEKKEIEKWAVAGSA
jgi:hypothetical protein